MIDLLLWPVLVFAFYTKKNILKTLILIWLICFSIVGSIVTAEYMFITLLFRVIFVPIYWLSAFAVAWGIQRWKSKREPTNEPNHPPEKNKVSSLIVDELSKSNKIEYDPHTKYDKIKYDPHAKYKPLIQKGEYRMSLDIKMVSEVFVELAVGHFNSDEALEELDKLKFTQENKLKVALGLRVVGFTLYSGLGSTYLFKHLIENFKYNENQMIKLRDSYLSESFNALSSSVQISKSAFGEMWNSYLKSIYGEIQKGIENPEYIWGENEHGGLKMGGILGVVLRKVFKTRGTREIFSDTDVDLFTFMEVALYFDSLFKACFAGLETDITEILKEIDKLNVT